VRIFGCMYRLVPVEGSEIKRGKFLDRPIM
jgi:hypothetical protein